MWEMTRRSERTRPSRLRFDGWIAGLGTSSGVRIVVGCWAASPFGAFTDVMVERGDGQRILLAPHTDVARFVSTTYRFDTTVVTPVDLQTRWPHVELSAGPLTLQFTTGGRTPLGRLLRAVPASIAATPAWASAVDPIARLVLPGVRATGSAGGGRREWYGARDLHRIVAASGSLDGTVLGRLAPVAPAVRFGFGSVPRRPSLVTVVTTVEGFGIVVVRNDLADRGQAADQEEN